MLWQLIQRLMPCCQYSYIPGLLLLCLCSPTQFFDYFLTAFYHSALSDSRTVLLSGSFLLHARSVIILFPPHLSPVREKGLWENLDRIFDLFNMIPIWSLSVFIAPCSSSFILQSSWILFFVLLEQTLADLIGTSPMLSTADGQGLWKFHDPSIS